MMTPSLPGRRRCLTGLGLLATGMFVRPALASPHVQRASRDLLGTRVDIVAQGSQASQATALAFAEMARLERLMSRYRPDSEISALNRSAGLAAVDVSPETLAVLRLGLELSQRSNGAFDITVGGYQGWSFDPANPRLPSAAQLRNERSLVNHRYLVLDPVKRQARLQRPGVKVDLGGVAKLPILQAGMRVLQAHGLDGAMLNGGGDVLVTGQLLGRDWRIGLRDPRAPERLLGTLELSDGVVASSGDYERAFIYDGKRYHHILDPHTGLPTQGVRGVALLARTPQAVNGWGATAMLMGAAKGQRLLSGLSGVESLMVDAQARTWMSAGMREQLKLSA
ncbi:FAD:protein FMN transferase [Rhodoferax sp.]|uniref:FAD:protein FMN transferase n=1 Tax=Rhodoferax sp. TaxID=50421 RepID=UPI00261A7EA6|nr:FAD:protein FMN transferase [Rhodoferax sp.]MDD3935092.1 FAD:protein FMN transferase [Rhodoferax sp.]